MKKQLLSIGQTAKLLGVSIDTLRRWDRSGKLHAVRSGARGHRYYKVSDINLFLKDLAELARQWVQSHVVVVEPESQNYCKTRDVFLVRLEKLQSDIAQIVGIEHSGLLTAVVGEIGSNSFDHNLGNWPDIVGIFFAYDKSRKQIVLADRGQGILATLKRVKPELTIHAKALRVAFTEIISGRAPEARGNGLKFVRSVIVNNSFGLFFQSGNAILSLHDSSELDIKSAEKSIQGCLAIVKF